MQRMKWLARAAATAVAVFSDSGTWTVDGTGTQDLTGVGLVAPVPTTCQVTASGQWTDQGDLVAEGDGGARVTVVLAFADGRVKVDADQGFALVSSGVPGAQPVVTRPAVFDVAKGANYGFGVRLLDVPTAMVGDTVQVVHTASCAPSGFDAC